MKCYYLSDNKAGDSALHEGFNWLRLQSVNTGGLIAVPKLADLEHYASLSGLESLKPFIKPPHRAMMDGNLFEIILPSKMIRHGINRPMLVIHPTKDFLSKVLRIRDVSEIYVISQDTVMGDLKN
ncbi:MAG TPA: hypothetical protein VH415_09930 [Nitrososphaeraceae archaeon]